MGRTWGRQSHDLQWHQLTHKPRQRPKGYAHDPPTGRTSTACILDGIITVSSIMQITYGENTMFIVTLVETTGRRYCAHAFPSKADAEAYGAAQIDGVVWSHYEIEEKPTDESGR